MCLLIYFKAFFSTWVMFIVFIEFVKTLLLFYGFLFFPLFLIFWPQSMEDLSSLTRD